MKIKTFMLNAPLIASQQHKMEQDIFIPDGMMDVTNLDKRYAQFNRILTEDACSAYVEILKNARTIFMEEQGIWMRLSTSLSFSRERAISSNGSKKNLIKVRGQSTLIPLLEKNAAQSLTGWSTLKLES